MTDIIEKAQELAALNVPWMRAEVTIHEDADPRYADDCLVQIIEEGTESAIWYEEEHGGYEHGKKHFAHVFAAAPEFTDALAEESYEYIVQVKCANAWQFYIGESHMVSDKPGAAYGFSQRSNALEFSKMETKRPTRIVRRRVSPVEVINE